MFQWRLKVFLIIPTQRKEQKSSPTAHKYGNMIQFLPGAPGKAKLLQFVSRKMQHF